MKDLDNRLEILKALHETLCKISEGLHKLKKLNETGSAKIKIGFMQTTEDTIVDYLIANRFFSDEEHEEVTVSLDEAIDVVESRLRMLEQIFIVETQYEGVNAYKMYPLSDFGYIWNNAKFAELAGLRISPGVKNGMYETVKKMDRDAIEELIRMKEEFNNNEDEDKWREEYRNRIDDWMNEIKYYLAFGYTPKHYTRRYLEEIGIEKWSNRPMLFGSIYREKNYKRLKEYMETRCLDVDKYIESLIEKKKRKIRP